MELAFVQGRGGGLIVAVARLRCELERADISIDNPPNTTLLLTNWPCGWFGVFLSRRLYCFRSRQVVLTGDSALSPGD